MRYSIRRCILTCMAIALLWLFIILEIPREIEDDKIIMLIEGEVATLTLIWGLGVGEGKVARTSRFLRAASFWKLPV